jgi:hypothetical protein
MMSESPGYQMVVILMEVQLLSVLSILGSRGMKSGAKRRVRRANLKP